MLSCTITLIPAGEVEFMKANACADIIPFSITIEEKAQGYIAYPHGEACLDSKVGLSLTSRFIWADGLCFPRHSRRMHSSARGCMVTDLAPAVRLVAPTARSRTSPRTWPANRGSPKTHTSSKGVSRTVCKSGDTEAQNNTTPYMLQVHLADVCFFPHLI